MNRGAAASPYRDPAQLAVYYKAVSASPGRWRRLCAPMDLSRYTMMALPQRADAIRAGLTRIPMIQG